MTGLFDGIPVTSTDYAKWLASSKAYWKRRAKGQAAYDREKLRVLRDVKALVKQSFKTPKNNQAKKAADSIIRSIEREAERVKRRLDRYSRSLKNGHWND